jgi:hypothetical protein
MVNSKKKSYESKKKADKIRSRVNREKLSLISKETAQLRDTEKKREKRLIEEFRQQEKKYDQKKKNENREKEEFKEQEKKYDQTRIKEIRENE